ncbi:hypothetical protein [Methylomonas sp. MgM2]
MKRLQGTMLAFFLGWASLGIASDGQYMENITTPGGTLIIRQLDQWLLGAEFVVILGQHEVLHTEEGNNRRSFPDFPEPRVIAYVAKRMPPFSAVAVFQQFSWGNACNGGPIWFLGIREEGTFLVSDAIDYCGGPLPIISVTEDAVYVVLPASKLADGDKPISKRVWIFRQGKVQQVR